MQLLTASDPTATIGGTPRPKMRMGRRRIPPPTPVIPTSVPTTSPIKIFAVTKDIDHVQNSTDLLRFGVRTLAIQADEGLVFQILENLLSSFLWTQFRCIKSKFGIGGVFIWIGYPCELLHQSRPCLGVQPLPVSSLANFERGGHMNEHEPAISFDHLPDVPARGFVWGNGRTDGDAAIFGDLRSHKTDPMDIEIAMFPGEAQFGRKIFSNNISVKQGHRTATDFEQLDPQHV